MLVLEGGGKNCWFCIEILGFCILKCLEFVLKMFDFALKCLDFVLKMFYLYWKCRSSRHNAILGRLGGRIRTEHVSKTDEFRIKNEEFCLSNEELCIKKRGVLSIKNEELCIKSDGFCVQMIDSAVPRRRPGHSRPLHPSLVRWFLLISYGVLDSFLPKFGPTFLVTLVSLSDVKTTKPLISHVNFSY